MTALNKFIRERIEEALIKATTIPAEKEALIKEAGATAREALRKTLPKGFEAAVKNLPPEWFHTEESVYLRTDSNVAHILADEEVRRHGHKDYLKFESLRKPASWYTTGQIPDLPPEDNKKATNWEAIMAKHVAAAHKLRKKEDELRTEIRGVIYSVNTAEKLIAKVPAWEKHITPHIPGKPMPLVVSTVKAENLLAKAGFDQTEKEAA